MKVGSTCDDPTFSLAYLKPSFVGVGGETSIIGFYSVKIHGDEIADDFYILDEMGMGYDGKTIGLMNELDCFFYTERFTWSVTRLSLANVLIKGLLYRFY